MPKVRKNANGWAVFCPGCRCAHVMDARWTFNGNLDLPTFTPSVLIRECGDGSPDGPYVCHSYVTDGNILFLADCTHEFAGKTVALGDF